jgi:hypothetical protein
VDSSVVSCRRAGMMTRTDLRADHHSRLTLRLMSDSHHVAPSRTTPGAVTSAVAAGVLGAM